MVPEKLARLLEISEEAVRTMQAAADIMRDAGLLAQAAYLETAATTLAAARHDVGTQEELAKLLTVAGRSVRAMQSAADVLREATFSGEILEDVAVKLSKALHDAIQDTVPISVKDVLDGDTWDENN